MDTLAKLKYLKKNKNIYLIFGEEKYLVQEAYDEIVNNVVSKENANMNIDYFIGKDAYVDGIIDAMNTLTFFSDNRCIVVKESGFFKKGQNVDTLVEELEKIAPTTYIVFVEEVDKVSSLYKAVKKLGVVYEMETPKENDLIGFVENLVSEKRCKIKRDATIHLLRTVENDMVVIKNEIGKLCAYVLHKGVIEKSDIDMVCTKSLQLEIFKLMDSIGNKEIQTALEIYNNMLFVKEPVLRILVMFARQVKLILLCKELSEKGCGLNEISEKIGVHSFVAKGCLAQSKNFSKSKLIEVLLEISNLETKIKSGKIKDEIGLENLIIALI